MVLSMTGYGKTVAELVDKNVVVEIKTLNSKQLDVSSRINHAYRDKDLEIRSLLAEKLIRGKIDISIFYDYKEQGNVRTINTPLVEAYVSQLQQLATQLHLDSSSILDIVMKMPDVMQSEQISEIDEFEWNAVRNAILGACNQIIEYRRLEGSALEHDIRENISAIQHGLESIISIEATRLDRIRERITTYVKECVVSEKFDESRFEQEMIYYIEKLDINEEKVRLGQHCVFFLETLSQEAVGKKLGFIAQEIGREINTIGSKSNDADMQKIVVHMKDNLERVKEQVLNVL